MKKYLLVFSVLFLFSTINAQTLYINEFIASNDTSYYDVTTDDYPDWIEIYNAGIEAVDIGGMYITDDLSELTAWQIPTTAPDSTTIPAGGFLVLMADKKPEAGVLHVNLKLGSGGEQIGLTLSDGLTIVDSLTYLDQTTDISEGRNPDGSDTWENFTTPTPGRSNSLIPTLFINEFLASNDNIDVDGTGTFPDWIEIYNAGVEAVDIGGMYITDDLAELTAWQIPTSAPDTTTIQPGGFLVLIANKTPELGVLHINLKLSGGGEQIGLSLSDGLTIVDSLTYLDQTTDVSFGRHPDGSDSWGSFLNPTPGYTNNNAVDVEENSDITATEYKLRQNYPNPFNPSTVINFSIPKSGLVTLKVFNVLGQEIAELVNDVKSAGNYEVSFDASHLTTGMYIYKIQSGNYSATKKMLLIK
ncbi:MAG: lamin tail domain-containing protein [Melioribacteraceae bacterium]|nr:lamin tail domain-containing protein [Melioribacteraceae bacterium]